MNEPARNHDIHSLTQDTQVKLAKLLTLMEHDGFDPVIYEGLRTLARQTWLYGIGRTHDTDRKPITWTMHSLHLKGLAADIISKSTGWNNPRFFSALQTHAREVGLFPCPGNKELCHVQAVRE